MPWYFRKSFSIGPLRLNLSKRGLGWSAGVKGARLGVDASGKPYVGGGRYGFYFRQHLGGRSSTPSSPRRSELMTACFKIILGGAVLLVIGGWMLVVGTAAAPLAVILLAIGAALEAFAVFALRQDRPSTVADVRSSIEPRKVSSIALAQNA